MPPSNEPSYTGPITATELIAAVNAARADERREIIDLIRKRADEIAVRVHKASGSKRILLPHGTVDLRMLADELERE